MKIFKKIANRIMKDERGQTMSEYALLLALIAVVCLIVLTAMGGQIKDKFTKVKDALQNANPE